MTAVLVEVTAVEVMPCRVVTTPDGPPFAVEPCAPAEAGFWTVYNRHPDGTAQAVTDHPTVWAAMVAATDHAAGRPVTLIDPTTGRTVDVRRTA